MAGEIGGFRKAGKGASRPMSGEEGSYKAFTLEADQPDESTSTIDASDFPDESHPLLRQPIGERIKKKTDVLDLGGPAVSSVMFPPNPTGYAAKHGEAENSF